MWFGAIDGTEETIIGIEKGVAKCRTIRWFPEDQRWDKKQIATLQGVPWASVNGSKGDHISVKVNGDGAPAIPMQANLEGEVGILFEEDVDTPTRPNQSGSKRLDSIEFHVGKPLIQKYGWTGQCPACQKDEAHSEAGWSYVRAIGHRPFEGVQRTDHRSHDARCYR